MVALLTKKEIEIIKKAEEAGKSFAKVSLDLGNSISVVNIKPGAVIINKQELLIKDFPRIKDDRCYLVEGNRLKPVLFFSQETNLLYKLVPTQDWPTVTLSSTRMHRVAKVSPKKDTLLKIKEVSPVKGKVLDTCCGLGYTAIESAKKAEAVFTFEKDPNIISIARLNPYSEDLFNNPKIKLKLLNVYDAIRDFEDSFFDRIIHDPPTFKYAPELYSTEFYKELFRVMKRGGMLYHYTPAPGRTKNRRFYPTVTKRLVSAGFKKVAYSRKSSGIKAIK